MTCDLAALRVGAVAPERVGRFWAALLDQPAPGSSDSGLELSLPDDGTFTVRFVPSSSQKVAQNSMHFDLTSSSPEHQQSTVDRAMRLGAQHVDVGQRGDEGHVVLADVEGNEFCVIEAGNAFLADCGFVGALACDGSQEAGYFWAAALGWPLVWDHDQETAIRSPLGGPKITWGGRPPMSQTDRLAFEIVPASGFDHDTEIDRLLSLGATRRTGVDLSDPDGNLFHILARP